MPIFINWLVIVLLVILTWIAWRAKKTILIIAGNVTVIFGYWIFSMVLFSAANLILPLFYPTLAFVAALSIMAIMQSVQRREKENSLKQLLKRQVTTKQKQLNEAKDKLSELQKLLEQETTVSEKTQQLAQQ